MIPTAPAPGVETGSMGTSGVFVTSVGSVTGSGSGSGSGWVWSGTGVATGPLWIQVETGVRLLGSLRSF